MLLNNFANLCVHVGMIYIYPLGVMDIKQDVVTIPHAIQYITSAVPLISMASMRQLLIFHANNLVKV